MPDPTLPLSGIPGLVRCESTSQDESMAICLEMTRSAYPHDQIFGDFVTLQDHVDCPPEVLWEYLSDVRSLEEWTYSTRDFRPTGEPGLYVGRDHLADDTEIYARVVADRNALTVDYHCAWDQGDKLWMIYLMRIVPAELVLNRRGSVVLWTNCRHPWYDQNPNPHLVPSPDRPWVGELWPLFYAGHALELANLKAIMEARHAAGAALGAAS